MTLVQQGIIAMEKTETEQPKQNKGLGYHFLPKRYQKANILKWLKRVHAWTGVWGALLFLMIGISGFLLNHRNTLVIDTGEAIEVAAIEVQVDPAFISSAHDLKRWVAKEFDVSSHRSQTRVREPEKAKFANKVLVQPAKWEVQFKGPNGLLRAQYVQGSGTIELKQDANTILGTLKNLHKGSGLSVLWILFFDTLAGALIFMSLTGILLWSKLHGPRIAGVGLLLGSVATAIIAAFPYWLSTGL
jgi:hypothetical protein